VTDVSDRLRSALAGRYTVERELGRGGMATIYLAHDLRHDRPVALKVMHPEVAAALGPERFLREIRISAQLDHPHILTLIDSGRNDGELWYVLPYVRGESLRAKLARETQLSVEQAVRIAAQVASALDYAHRRGVIHRDIKPENILLHEGEAMVADFGIALAVREAGGERLTETGLSLGTPHYMSPEQATGSREPDPRSDVYSLGAVVYEMLAGEPPHTGPTAQAVIAKLLSEPPTRIHTVRPDVPEHIDAAVAKALAKVPADRFASAAEFATALERPDIRAPATRRHRGLATMVAGAGLVILLVAAVLAVRHSSRPHARTATHGTDVASVAVLPFENLTGNPADAYLSDGMTEEVIGQLAQVPELKVISRTSSGAIKGAHLTLRQIADTLDVRHILEGSVRHAGRRIRVAVDLIDATTDTHVWAASYDRDLTDVFSVQQEIARHIADSLGSTVGVRPSIRRVARTEDPGAYEAYLSGRSLMYQRTPEALRGALNQFDRAIARDSSYAPAYAGLASLYAVWPAYDYSGIDLYDAYGRALALADRAIALDSTLAEGYTVRGYVLTLVSGPTDQIRTDFHQALELRPSSANVHQWYAQFLSREGRHGEAISEMERAVSLDPLAPGVRTGYASVALAARRYDVAEREASRAAAFEPSLMVARGQQAIGRLLSGHADSCLALSLGPYVGRRAMCLHSLGRDREAAQLADSLRLATSRGRAPDPTFGPAIARRNLAEYFAWNGRVEESVTWMERAFAVSPLGNDFRLSASGLYDKVRADPRFQASLERAQSRAHGRVERARRSFAEQLSGVPPRTRP
jgi:TolB-like protein/tetratricopeptide (TPR) repeat protein